MKPITPQTKWIRGTRYNPGDKLDETEKRILIYWSNGFNNHDISMFTGMSEYTLKMKNNTILFKLETTNRTNAVARALREGIIE